MLTAQVTPADEVPCTPRIEDVVLWMTGLPSEIRKLGELLLSVAKERTDDEHEIGCVVSLETIGPPTPSSEPWDADVVTLRRRPTLRLVEAAGFSA